MKELLKDDIGGLSLNGDCFRIRMKRTYSLHPALMGALELFGTYVGWDIKPGNIRWISLDCYSGLMKFPIELN